MKGWGWFGLAVVLCGWAAVACGGKRAKPGARGGELALTERLPDDAILVAGYRRVGSEEEAREVGKLFGATGPMAAVVPRCVYDLVANVDGAVMGVREGSEDMAAVVHGRGLRAIFDRCAAEVVAVFAKGDELVIEERGETTAYRTRNGETTWHL